MGSLRWNGVRFVAYSDDHLPRHVHGFAGEVEAIVELRFDGDVQLALRKDAVRPSNGKRSDVNKILSTAAKHFEELVKLWEKNRAEA